MPTKDVGKGVSDSQGHQRTYKHTRREKAKEKAKFACELCYSLYHTHGPDSKASELEPKLPLLAGVTECSV